MYINYKHRMIKIYIQTILLYQGQCNAIDQRGEIIKASFLQ